MRRSWIPTVRGHLPASPGATAAPGPRAIRWYLGTCVALVAAGLAVRPLAAPVMIALVLLGGAVLIVGPTLAGAVRAGRWRIAGAAAVGAGMLAWIADEITLRDGHAAPPWLYIGSYLLTVVVAVAVISGRSRMETRPGGVDVLVLFTTLVALVVTLLAMLLAHDEEVSGAQTPILVVYLTVNLIMLGLLARQYRRDHRDAGMATWLAVVAVQLMLLADIGALACNQLSEPSWVRSLSVLWLFGLVLLGVAALSPRRADDDTGVVARPTVACTGTVALLAVGPPMELVEPSVTHIVTVLLITMACLLLVDTYQRIRSEQAIRSAAAALAAAVDAPTVLAATLRAARACTGGRQGTVVCAEGPDGVQGVAGSGRIDPGTAESAADLVEQTLAHVPHTAVRSPAAAATVAIGVTGRARIRGYQLGPLELLAGQASMALNRLVLTRELARRDRETYFRALVSNAADMIITVDPAGRIDYASPSTAAGFDRDLTGEALDTAVGQDNAAAIHAVLDQPDRPASPDPLHWELRTAGVPMDVEASVADLRTNPTIGGLVITLRDITAEQRLNRKLRHLAYHDPLTDLHNLAWLRDHADEVRAATNTTTVLLGVDIDGLTEINDIHGGSTADRILTAIAARLTELHNCVIRWEAGRFAVLAHPTGPLDTPERLARLLVERLSTTIDLGSKRIAVAVSVGAARLDTDIEIDEALRRTSLATTEAKADPRRRWRAYRPAMLTAVLDRDMLTRDLAAALEDRLLTCHYQPLVDLRTGRIEGFEALARWRHPHRGSISPATFIPMAEETGLIAPLSRHVLYRATRDIARLRKYARRELHVAVNIAAQQLTEPDFPELVAHALQAAALPAQSLCLEITERSVLTGGSRSMDTLHALKSMGVTLAIDDFGTGQSALSYLLDLPFDTLKIDKSFVDRVAGSARHTQLVDGITGIAAASGMSTVAEGVETPDQHDILTTVGCDTAQGFLYSPAVPVDQAAPLLDQTWSAPHLPTRPKSA